LREQELSGNIEIGALGHAGNGYERITERGLEL